MRELGTLLGRLIMLALFAAALYAAVVLAQAISARWAVVRGSDAARPAAAATADRPLFAIVTPTREPTPSPTATPTRLPTVTPFPTVPALGTLRPTATPARRGPFRLEGKIEKIEGRTWTIAGQAVLIPFAVRGRPRVGADAVVEGVVRPDGVWEAKRVEFSP